MVFGTNFNVTWKIRKRTFNILKGRLNAYFYNLGTVLLSFLSEQVKVSSILGTIISKSCDGKDIVVLLFSKSGQDKIKSNCNHT